jgi:hypothetical protein
MFGGMRVKVTGRDDYFTFRDFARVFRASHVFAGTFPMMDRIDKKLEDMKLSVRAADELPGTRTTYSVFNRRPSAFIGTSNSLTAFCVRRSRREETDIITGICS